MSKLLFNIFGFLLKKLAFSYLNKGNLPYAEALFEKTLFCFDKSMNFKSAFDCQIQLGNIYKLSNLFDFALEMFDAALTLANKLNRPYYQAVALTNRAMIFAILSQYERAVLDYNQALIFANNSINHSDNFDDLTNLIPSILHNYGVLEQQYQNYSNAIELLNKSIIAYKKNDNIPACAFVLADLGEVFAAVNNDEEAIAAWGRALEIFLVENNDFACADIYLNLGQIKSDTALLNKSLKINQQYNRDIPYANSCTALALILLNEQKFDKAANLLFQAVEIEIKLDLLPALARDYANLALLFKMQNNNEFSAEYLNKAIDIARSINDEEFINQINTFF